MVLTPATTPATTPAITRCSWCGTDPLYQQCHDQEWGVPVHGDRVLFEFLVLEGAQAGLSWITVLRKRESYRKAFAHFDYRKVAAFDDSKVEELMLNEGLIRNRLKLMSVLRNARAFLEVRKEFGSFDAYVWSFVNNQQVQNRFDEGKQVPAITPVAAALSKDLKKRGFNFVGPTIMYAFMQATGMVNDHVKGCFRARQLGA